MPRAIGRGCSSRYRARASPPSGRSRAGCGCGLAVEAAVVAESAGSAIPTPAAASTTGARAARLALRLSSPPSNTATASPFQTVPRASVSSTRASVSRRHRFRKPRGRGKRHQAGDVRRRCTGDGPSQPRAAGALPRDLLQGRLGEARLPVAARSSSGWAQHGVEKGGHEAIRRSRGQTV